MFKVSPSIQVKTQALATTCWLTCLEMLFQWKKDKGDSSKDKSQICNIIDEKTQFFSSIMVEKGIGTNECASVARALGMQPTGTGDYTRDILYDLVSKKGPLFVAGKWGGSSHVILVTGCSNDSDEIKIVDPWKNYDLSESDSNLTWLNSRGSTWKGTEGSVMYWK